jgi:hypothetical protein
VSLTQWQICTAARQVPAYQNGGKDPEGAKLEAECLSIWENPAIFVANCQSPNFALLRPAFDWMYTFCFFSSSQIVINLFLFLSL